MWIYNDCSYTVFFVGLTLQTIGQKNRQDFEMQLIMLKTTKDNLKNEKTN